MIWGYWSRVIKQVSVSQDPRVARMAGFEVKANRPTLEQIRMNMVIQSLKKSRGNVTATAKELGITRGTVYNFCQRLGISIRRMKYLTFGKIDIIPGDGSKKGVILNSFYAELRAIFGESFGKQIPVWNGNSFGVGVKYLR